MGHVKQRERLLRVSLFWRTGILIGYLVLVAMLSLLPAYLFPPAPASLPGSDKIVHFMMYAGLAALIQWSIADRQIGPGCRYRLLATIVAYGILMEMLQSVVSGGSRGFEWGDIAANTLGALTAWWIAGRLFAEPIRK